MSVLDLRKLAEPFPPDEIEWRVGSTTANKDRGLALAYLTARHVMDRLDEVCGPEGWQVSYHETPKGRVIGTISIKVGSDWISKSDGAGETDVEGEKGAISDALKRAAVPWGIGRYLYTLESPWVEIEPMGRSFKIKESEKEKLIRILKRQTGAPEPKQEPSPPKPKQKTVAERKALWATLMSEVKKEGAKGYKKIDAYMLNPETQGLIEQLGDYKQQFLEEVRQVRGLTKAGEEISGQPVGKIMERVLPSFENLDTSPDPLEELIGSMDLQEKDIM